MSEYKPLVDDNGNINPKTEEYVWTINSNGKDTKVQKITRCKDCMYWIEGVSVCYMNHDEREADDFCSRGVMR